MKQTFYTLGRTASILIVLLMTLLLVESAPAQIVKVSTEVWKDKHLANSAVDSSARIPLYYNGDQFPELRGCVADSVRIFHAHGDSVKVDLAYTTTYTDIKQVAYTTSDSMVSSTIGYSLVAVTATRSRDYIKVKATARGADNAIVSSHGRFWLRVERYFTKPR